MTQPIPNTPGRAVIELGRGPALHTDDSPTARLFNGLNYYVIKLADVL